MGPKVLFCMIIHKYIWSWHSFVSGMEGIWWLADSTIWQRLCILQSDKDFIDREDAWGWGVAETAKDLATL